MTINIGTAIDSPVRVDPVTSRGDLQKFIAIPWKVYADDKFWVPPLKLERRLHLSSHNSYFKNAEWQAWLAFRDNVPVGRISAQIDAVHQKFYGANSGHFGFIEAENDPEIFKKLFEAAEDWLIERGVAYVTGPFNFSINQESGVLVEGFDTPPSILMPHSRQWYGPLIEGQGYRPAMDMLAYWMESKVFGENPVMNKLVKRYGPKVQIRPLNKKIFNQELEILRNIFNDAWSNNWGFIPFSKEEFAELGAGLKPFVPDGYI
ncbi:MAG: N-acetyltransferase, partial [Gammaproteobacteria bacterium]|nr:N-acetyltransferase [Gammaproteobacteria bacterium]